MPETRIECDILVIGGGMGGLTTGARAAQEGAEVLVVEKAGHLGGSAAMSGGYLWTAPDLEAFVEEDPEGDEERFARLLDHVEEASAWLDGLDVHRGEWETGIKGFGVGRQIDIGGYITQMQRFIEGSGGWVVYDTKPTELIVEEGIVHGARVENVLTGERAEVRAGVTVIATGGFQGDPELRERFIHPGAADDLVLRSNEESRGDGIELGMSAGGSLTEHMHGYYGHLIPYPLDEFEEADHVLLAQYYSEHAVIVGRDGQRFMDESLGDHVDTQAVGRVKRALMIIDEEIRQQHVLKAYMSGLSGVDKLAEGASRGAHYVSTDSLEDLAATSEAWGYDGESILRTVADYNAYCNEESDEIDPPRKRYRHPVQTPPFAAVEVQSAITFTYGGLRTDPEGRVLSETGEPVDGLFAVGVDAGGLNRLGYTGGLIRGFVFGHRLGRHLADETASRRAG